MLRGMSDRLALALTLLFVFLSITLCLCYAAIFVSPEIALNPFPPSKAALNPVIAEDGAGAGALSSPQPIRPTGTPTFPPTWTPTPTATATATPTRTLTPTPTFTWTPTDTPTPTQTPTNTPRPPKPPPPPPPPTFTFTPYPTEPTSLWKGTLIATWVNCGSTGLFGKVRGPAGDPIGGVWVHYWADGWDGAWAESKSDYWGEAGDRNWDGLLANFPKAGRWHAAIAAGEGSHEYLSNTVTADTSDFCEGHGASQWIEIEFVRNY